MAMVHERYQVGDDICGQYERAATKFDALEIGLTHWRRDHKCEVAVTVYDCMHRKNKDGIVWTYQPDR